MALQLQKIKVIEVIDSYDGPTIYTVVANDGDFYLVYLCDIDVDDESVRTWLYLYTNPFKISCLKKNEISIKQFIQESKQHLIVKTTGTKISSFSETTFAEIPTEYIPSEGVFLDLGLEEYQLKLKKKNLAPSNISSAHVSAVINRISNGLKGVMKGVQTYLAEFPENEPDPMLALTTVMPGSVELTLKPIKHNPLLKKSFEIIELVVAEQTQNLPPALVDTVRYEIAQMSPSGRSGFNFDSIELSSAGDSKKTIGFTYEVRKKMKELLPIVENFQVPIIVKGKIMAFDKRDFTFVISDFGKHEEVKNSDIPSRAAEADLLSDDVKDLAYQCFDKGDRALIAGDYNTKENLLIVRKITPLKPIAN